MNKEEIEKILDETLEEIEKERREILVDSFNVNIFSGDSQFYRDRYFENEGKRSAATIIKNKLYKLVGDIE